MTSPNLLPPEPPELPISINGSDMVLTWYNAGLWTHSEYYREYDHIFIQTPEDEETNNGLYVFRGIENTRAPFTRLAGFMIAQDFNHMHKAVPSEGDARNFEVARQNTKEWLAEKAITQFQQELENIDWDELK